MIPIDPIIAVAAFVAGQWLPRPPRRRSTPKLRKPPQPVCGCKHHHGFHDPQTGQCHGKMDGKPLRYDIYNEPTAWEQIPCTCRQYSGPVPMAEYFAPEITP